MKTKAIWYRVEVIFDRFVLEDGIKGTNPEQALKRAYWNWPDALEITVLGEWVE